MSKIAEIATSRSLSLENSYSLQQFLFEVHIQMSWINEHLAQIKIAEFGSNVTTAQRLLNRHEVSHPALSLFDFDKPYKINSKALHLRNHFFHTLGENVSYIYDTCHF